MRTRLVIFSVAVLLAAGAGRAQAVGGPVPAAGPWTLHSSFLMSLHQRLMDAAMAQQPADLSALSPDERAAWTRAVAAYRTAGGSGDMSFSAPMMTTSDELTQVGDDAVDPPAAAPMHDALAAAAPIYRARWWAGDDRASQFFRSYAVAMLAEAGRALIERHEKVYGAPWPASIRVYLTPAAGPFGAYTFIGRKGGVTTTMASREPDYQGLRVLEMFLHESSHAIVFPNNGRVAAAIAAASKARGIDPPRNLWHAILFATSGEIARQYLAERGAETFHPASADMLTRVWPQFREPIEKFWIPYVNGQGTLEDAIDKVVGALRGVRTSFDVSKPFARARSTAAE